MLNLQGFFVVFLFVCFVYICISFLNKPEIYNTLEQEQLKKNKRQDGNFITYFKKLVETQKNYLSLVGT